MINDLPLKESKVSNKNFKAEKVQDILSNDSIVRITSDDDTVFIRCSKQSVEFRGNISFTSRKDLEDFAKLISDAWKFHLSLK
jgi:type IV secretory pathway ATPase VirB11/archaellum biosynthesis ATPase